MADHTTTTAHAGGDLRARFYRSIAETLTLLHSAPGRDRRAAMAEVAATLSQAMDLPLVWIGVLPEHATTLDVAAAAGPARDYARALHISVDASLVEGRGPVGQSLRDGQPRMVRVDAPEFAPWRVAARAHGLQACLVAVAPAADGARLVLAMYGTAQDLLQVELLDWAQRLVIEIARYWDHQSLLDREQRLRRYRDAQRTIHSTLLAQPDPEAIYRTLAEALVDVAGAAAVDVFIDEGAAQLCRVALAGPLAGALRTLPLPPRAATGAAVPTPTQAFVGACGIVRRQPAEHVGIEPGWRQPPLSAMGALACWPIFGGNDLESVTAPAAPSGVFAVVAREADTFDTELCALLDEVADAAGLALRQHGQRQALARERERQTHLALHDALTGLPNRRALEHQLEGALARARRHHLLIGVGILDLDDFKPANDRLGHVSGDRLLASVAERLRDALRAEDYVARLGGDEFVLVFEDLARAEDLDALLERVHAALDRPYSIDTHMLTLHASLGVALFPVHAETGETLLRRADQAMYAVKAHKHDAHRWWSLPPPDTGPENVPSERAAFDAQPYGAAAARLLRTLAAVTREVIDNVVEPFYLQLAQMAEPARLLQILPIGERAALHTKQRAHLQMLLQPDLDAATHHAAAEQAGRVHAGCGIETVWLTDSVEHMREALDAALSRHVRRDRRSLLVLHRRLAQDRQWQLEGMRAVQRGRDALIARVSALAWSAESYSALMQGVVEALVQHEEIISCTVGRPDGSGSFAYEAVGGEAFSQYLRALAQGDASPISSDAGSPLGRGPSGRAWHSGRIERCAHYATDPAMAPWRAFALQTGVRSSAVLPLGARPGAPLALLALYSRYPGGFSGDAQQAFAAQLKTLLDLALARLAPDHPGIAVLPFTVRERWRARLAADGIEMHYQPVVALARGAVVELEALARLRDADASLHLPGDFLSVLNADDLLRLFRIGLTQALAQRAALAARGHTLDIALNLPPAALRDTRYAAVARTVLADSACPPRALLLEVLESATEAEHALGNAVDGILALKALGVRVVEDDLGAGHSSLARLRQWPFDRVKIDQTLVHDVTSDPLRTLRFVRQLTLLGHALGIEVVVEGLETPGLVEAALILGADFGQGYALARPCAADALPRLLDDFHHDFDARAPRTALGACAGALLWDEALRAGGADPALWQHLSEAPCLAQAFLDVRPDCGTRLAASHAAMHRAARGGPAHPDYHAARAAFEQALAHCVRAEEAGAR